MEKNNENMVNKLSDQEMEDVSGDVFDQTIDVITWNTGNNYRSGDTPKYKVGQTLGIQAEYRTTYTKLPCMVLSVSESPTGGIFNKEFVYSVKILRVGPPTFRELEGKVYDGVYESCLYD